jgi:putative NADH-flavin reductase
MTGHPPLSQRLTVVGATGSVGRPIVEQALAAGHAVTALVRDPARHDLVHPALEVVAGDATDLDDVRRSVKGADAVVVALGDGRAGHVRATGTRAVVRAMAEEDVERLVCVSTLGAGDSRGNLNLLWKHVMFGLLLRRAYADHQEQERLVMASDLDWTIVRPGAYTDGPRTGDYRHGFGPDATGLRLKVSRSDVADFVLRQVGDRTYSHRAAGLSY